MDRFILAGEHTVIDTETRLMWMRTDSMNDMEKWVNYQESVDYVRNLCESKIAGFSDWRLPSREEISTLFNESYSIKDKFEKEHTKALGWLLKNGYLEINIYDLKGRLVESLYGDYTSSGQHIINWNADMYSSGVYLANPRK